MSFFWPLLLDWTIGLPLDAVNLAEEHHQIVKNKVEKHPKP